MLWLNSQRCLAQEAVSVTLTEQECAQSSNGTENGHGDAEIVFCSLAQSRKMQADTGLSGTVLHHCAQAAQKRTSAPKMRCIRFPMPRPGPPKKLTTPTSERGDVSLLIGEWCENDSKTLLLQHHRKRHTTRSDDPETARWQTRKRVDPTRRTPGSAL